MSRFLVVFLLPVALLFAQEQPAATPEPTPEATPEPTPEATPETGISEGVPEPTPAAADHDNPTPLQEPAPTQDVIPLEGQPQPGPEVTGAPLDTTDLAPMDQDALPDAAFTDPNAIVPEEVPPAVPVAMESAEEKARQLSIRYKEVRVQAEKDPKVASLLKQANEAKSPEGNRAAYREYYRLLFKKMVSIDKSLEERCRVMEEAYIRRFAQDRLEPTIPLNPPPTPEPLD